MYPGNNRQQHRAPRPATAPFSFKQVEIARTEDGARRLVRCELNGKVTGFVEKHFKDNVFVREFALGGSRNGVNEAVATARFNGVEIKPAPVAESLPPKAKPTPDAGLPAFITKPEPTAVKSTKPKARSVPVKPVSKAKPKSSGNPKPTMTRKEGLALAGNLFRPR